MKFRFLLLVLSFVSTEMYAQIKQSTRDFTSVHHYRNNISLRNFDGTHSSIYYSGNSATLVNSNGLRSTIDSFGDYSILFSIDGSTSTIFHNGFSSTVHNTDGTQIIINHRRNSSFCTTLDDKHTLIHNFGLLDESCNDRKKNIIDILVHVNWAIQKKLDTI